STGSCRRIRGSSSLRSAASTIPASSASTSAPAAAILNLHAAAGRQSKLAFRYDRLAGIKPSIDDQILIDSSARDHRPHRDGPILIDNVDELAILSGLNGLIRDNQRVRTRGQSQRHANEFAGPKSVVSVLESSFELDRSRARIDRVVDKS